MTLGVRLTWFTVGLSPPVSLKASWCSEDAVLPVWQGQVLPASWRPGQVKDGQGG